MEGQQSRNSSVYICWENAPLESSSLSQNGRAEIDQPQSIFLYNKGIRGVDRLDQNIRSYMTGHLSKK